MPPLTKKQRRARDQRASRARVFTSGLIEDLSNKTTDLNYQPDSDSDVSVQDISFHHIDREVISDSSEVEEGSTESNNNPVVCIGEKRKVRVDTEDSDNDHIPVCACLISRFRSFIFYQAEKKSSKCSMNAMPSYTGAGRTSTYLWERNLHHAAKGCKKITSFFTSVTKVTEHTPSAPELIVATTESASPPVEEHRMPVLSSTP